MSIKFAIFGASGDLTARYLMPALAQLSESGLMPHDVEVIGFARHDWNTEEFRSRMRKALEKYGEGSSEDLLSRLRYVSGDVTDTESVRAALDSPTEPVIAYLALPPGLFASVIRSLAEIALPEGSRVVVEKPFGEDLDSARQLNHLLHEAFPETATFRMDHFLGHQTVQNILGLRFANRIFEPIWNGEHVEEVEITWDETLALEGRAGYYDSAGALRDMIQNHLLQLLCLVAIEPPLAFNERDLRDRKVELLRAVRQMSEEDVKRDAIRARYSAGSIGDRELPGYKDEEGVDPGRETETFAQVTVHIDNWRWAGTRFVMRTGKALREDRREILIRFRKVPHVLFPMEPPAVNVLRLELSPDRLALVTNINGPGDPSDLECVELEHVLAPQELTPYARLLQDILQGDPTLSIRDDEAEAAWRIVEPITGAWEKGLVPLLEYPVGSDGPQAP